MYGTGATWQEVADACGYRHRNSARQAVLRLTSREPAESPEQARRKHDEALRMIQQRNFTRYLHAVKAGDDETAVKYSKEIRGTVETRARMGGVFAPQQVELGLTDAEFSRQVAELVATLRPGAIRDLVRAGELEPTVLEALEVAGVDVEVIDAEVVEEPGLAGTDGWSNISGPGPVPERVPEPVAVEPDPVELAEPEPVELVEPDPEPVRQPADEWVISKRAGIVLHPATRQ